MDKIDRIECIFSKLEKLPTLPGIAMRILAAVRNAETSLKEIGDILATDPSLSAEVLKAINSPFYGLATKITSVSHAVNLLGIKTVKSLALSFSLVRNIRSKEANGFDYSNFWRNSLIAAVSAKILAEKVLPDFAEDAFFLGLIHNIGILAMNQCIPEQYKLVLKEKERTLCAYHEAENQILGFNHMQLGEYLAKSWGLPDTFFIPIRYHHEFKEMVIQDPGVEITAKLLQLSSLFIDLNNFEDKRFYMAIAQLEILVKKYGFEDKLRIDEITKLIHSQTMNVFPLFDIEITKEKDYVKLIEEARNELINLSSDFMLQLFEQNKLIQSLSEQTMRDGLTDLLNFHAFHDSLDKEIQRAKRYKHHLGLIMADIDHFKDINDTYGHLAGDHILKAVAKFFKDFLRTSDIVARYGGEEFAIILPETSKSHTIIVAERLREAIDSMTIEYENRNISVSLSFGISCLEPSKQISNTELIKEADAALYQAKGAGRNTCRCLEMTSFEN